MKIWIVFIHDDRYCDPMGAHIEERFFTTEDKARNWLADWIKEDIESNLGDSDDDDPNLLKLLELHKVGKFSQLFDEYGSCYCEDVRYRIYQADLN